MYPEFQYRRPPPTYAASMQAYQAQMADAQSNNNTANIANNNSDDFSLPGSPPPSYRSRASTIHSGVHITFPPGHDSAPNSRPPTYRSRADSHQRPRLPMDDFEAPSPSNAPADVSFTGPVMTADTVQQIIGTDRNHRRQQSADAVVWHTRSASLDLAQGSDIVHHRRGASLDHSNASVPLGLNSQEIQTPSRQSESAVFSSGPAPDSTAGSDSRQSETAAHTAGSDSRQSETAAQPALASPSTEAAQSAAYQTACPDSEQGVGSKTGQREDGGAAGQSVTKATGDQDSEPEQYNTAL